MWIKAYKGFNNKLQCQPDSSKLPFQYEVGKKYEEASAELCDHGFHACENPMDVFNYYSPANSRFCEVDLDATNEKRNDDSKRCGGKIRIGAEIGIDGIIKAGVKFILDKVDFKNANSTNTGDCSAATNTGNRSAATNTGNWSAATNTGDCSAATVSGQESVACALGESGKAKGSIGCWIVLAEWKDGHRVNVQCFLVDGKKIKVDTWYMLKDGEAVEVDEM